MGRKPLLVRFLSLLPIRQRPSRTGSERPRPGRHVYGYRRRHPVPPPRHRLGSRRLPACVLQGEREAADVPVVPSMGSGTPPARITLVYVGGGVEAGPNIVLRDVREVGGAATGVAAPASAAEMGRRREEPLRPMPPLLGHNGVARPLRLGGVHVANADRADGR
ncbi:hypothetical protein OPV22_027768 [Ensete ventricosum]|uniref:Uncharacterized protein n=1 Tax=Ensete ventricosum TaxID=4639 RepID=A0AAV8Q6N9_ENSVE|nr:hypothetical protein OPV22_027768 [Ensete ventricosum]